MAHRILTGDMRASGMEDKQAKSSEKDQEVKEVEVLRADHQAAVPKLSGEPRNDGEATTEGAREGFRYLESTEIACRTDNLSVRTRRRSSMLHSDTLRLAACPSPAGCAEGS